MGIEKGINHGSNPIADLLKKSTNFADSVKSKKKRSVLKESKDKDNNEGLRTLLEKYETLTGSLVEQLKIANERLDILEEILDGKVVVEAEDEKVKILVGKTMLEGEMRQVRKR